MRPNPAQEIGITFDLKSKAITLRHAGFIYAHLPPLAFHLLRAEGRMPGILKQELKLLFSPILNLLS